MTRVSVVVISKNERGLADTLRALAPQCGELGAELLVVDASDGALDHIAADHPDVRWIPFTRPAGKRITIPEQRNLGVDAASGDVVVFTDCGCVPDPGWLATLTAPILAGREEIVAGAVRSLRPSVYDAVADAEPSAQHYVDECATCNLAFTRRAFAAVEGFDESFDYGSDVDITWRWRDAGYRILRLPAAVIRMDWGTGRRQVRRGLLWGAGRARLYAKHRHRLRELPRRDPTALIYPVFLLGLPVLALAPVVPLVLLYPLLLAVPLWRNRRRRPVHTVGGHLVYGVGMLWQLGRELAR